MLAYKKIWLGWPFFFFPETVPPFALPYHKGDYRLKTFYLIFFSSRTILEEDAFTHRFRKRLEEKYIQFSRYWVFGKWLILAIFFQLIQGDIRDTGNIRDTYIMTCESQGRNSKMEIILENQNHRLSGAESCILWISLRTVFEFVEEDFLTVIASTVKVRWPVNQKSHYWNKGYIECGLVFGCHGRLQSSVSIVVNQLEDKFKRKISWPQGRQLMTQDMTGRRHSWLGVRRNIKSHL